MKENKNRILIFLSILSFLTVGGILIKGEIKKQSLPEKIHDTSFILGESVQSLEELKENNPVNRFVQNTIETTRETVALKAAELEKSIVATIEKEIANITKSQMDALKLQICRDWGVVSISPTPSQNQ